MAPARHSSRAEGAEWFCCLTNCSPSVSRLFVCPTKVVKMKPPGIGSQVLVFSVPSTRASLQAILGIPIF